MKAIRRYRRLCLFEALAMIVLTCMSVAVIGADGWTQRDAVAWVERIDRESKATVSYRNAVLDDRAVVRLCSRFGFRRPVPFDRPVEVQVSGTIDDRLIDEIVTFAERAGEPYRLTLYGRGDEMTNDGLRRIGELRGLRELRIQLNSPAESCDDVGGQAIAKLPRLVRLMLASVPIGDRTAQALAATNAPGLRRVEWHHSHITDVGLEALVGLSALRRLEVRDGDATREGAWAFRLARPEVIFGGPNVPRSVSGEEFRKYRQLHERLRQQWGGPGPSTPPHAFGR